MVQVEIIATDALDAAHIGRWREMLAASPDLCSPYFRPEFTQVAGRISPGAAVAVFRRGGEVVGYFPHQRRGGSIQPLGAPLNDYHGVIAFPGQGPSLAETARLLNGARLNVGGWVGPAGGEGETRQTCQVAMPHGYDGWYAERRATWGKYFKDKERARRSLEAEFGPLTVQTDIRDPDLLDRLIALKREQYRRTGRHDVFACGWTADLLHALMQTRGEGGFGASLAALWAGDSLCAVEYSMHAGDQFHFWFPAYVPGLARCSPGILLSMDTMRAASEQGYATFDFGFAGEGYKKYFCNAERDVTEAVIVRPGLGADLSRSAVGLLNLAGDGRGERLRASLRRRWAAIEACEVTAADRFRGVAYAARVALSRRTQPA